MKRLYIFIGILFVIVVIFITIALNAKNNAPQSTIIPVPTEIPQSAVTKAPTPSQITPTPQNIFDNKTVKKELDLLENRQALSSSDITTKNLLINSLPTDGETIHETDTYTILYVKSLDEFQVEVTTTDIQQTRNDSVNWFLSQGMSHEGICKLPLTYFTTNQIYQQLKAQGIKDVAPLADGC